MAQVPQVREALLRSVPCWRALAEAQKATAFCVAAQQSGTAQQRRNDMLATIDFMCSLDSGEDDAAQLDRQVCRWYMLVVCHVLVVCPVIEQQQIQHEPGGIVEYVPGRTIRDEQFVGGNDV